MMRKIKIARYERAIAHLKANTDWESEVLRIINMNIRDAKASKSKSNIKSYMDDVDFRLRDTFGVKVILE